MSAPMWSAGLLGPMLLAATPAFAQNPPPPPPLVEEEGTGTGTGYAADLPNRPLVLPADQMEIDANLWIPTNDSIDFFDFVLLGVSARRSFGLIEPFFGLDIAIIKPDGADTMQTLVAGARGVIGPGNAKGAFFLFQPGSDAGTSIEIDGSYEYKHLFNPKFAVIGEGGLAFSNFSSSEEGFGDVSLTIVSLFARAIGQAMVTPEASVQGGLQFSLPVSDSCDVDGMDCSDQISAESVTILHGMGLYNLDKIDVYGRLDLRFSDDETTTTFTVGMLARPMM